MDSKELINHFAEKYEVSNATMALLFDVNISSINNWRRGVKQMSEKNKEHFEMVLKSLDSFVKRSGYSEERAISFVLALKGTPDWNGWDKLSTISEGPIKNKQGHSRFESFIIDQLPSLLPEYRNFKQGAQSISFDALAENSKGEIVGIEIKWRKIDLPDLGPLLNMMAKETIKSEIKELILVALDFSPAFLETIKSIPQKIITKKINFSFQTL